MDDTLNASLSNADGVEIPTDQPEFRVLDDEPEGAAATLLPEGASVEPFTAEEIVSGAAFVLVLGLRLENDAETAAFREAFGWVLRPVLPTAKVLEQLEIGQALAQYGIGKGMGLGGGGLDMLPAWARLAAGVVALGVAGYMGKQAVIKERGGVPGTVEDGPNAVE